MRTVTQNWTARKVCLFETNDESQMISAKCHIFGEPKSSYSITYKVKIFLMYYPKVMRAVIGNGYIYKQVSSIEGKSNFYYHDQINRVNRN